MKADEKLKVSVTAKQHAVDWGTGMVSREQREHSYRIGEAAGYQRAIDVLDSAGHFTYSDASEHLEEQK